LSILLSPQVKKGPKTKIKKQGYTVSQGRVKQNHIQEGKAKFPENSRERKRITNIPHHIVSPQNLHPEAAIRERQVPTTRG